MTGRTFLEVFSREGKCEKAMARQFPHAGLHGARKKDKCSKVLNLHFIFKNYV